MNSRIEFDYNLNNMAHIFARRSMSRLSQMDQATPEKKVLSESTYQIKQMEDFSKFKMGSLEIER